MVVRLAVVIRLRELHVGVVFVHLVVGVRVLFALLQREHAVALLAEDDEGRGQRDRAEEENAGDDDDHREGLRLRLVSHHVGEDAGLLEEVVVAVRVHRRHRVVRRAVAVTVTHHRDRVVAAGVHRPVGRVHRRVVVAAVLHLLHLRVPPAVWRLPQVSVHRLLALTRSALNDLSRRLLRRLRTESSANTTVIVGSLVGPLIHCLPPTIVAAGLCRNYR